MIMQALLYSRSARSDYRWLHRPKFVSDQDMALLGAFYDAYDTYKNHPGLEKVKIDPLFCVDMPSAVALFRCGRTELKDIYGRDIYALQGLAMQREEKKVFGAVLEYLVDSHQESLSVWRFVDFATADQLHAQPLLVETTIEGLSKALSPTLAMVQKQAHLLTNQVPRMLPYSAEGYARLLHVLASPYLPLISFAFGISARFPKALASNLYITAQF